MKNQVTPSLTQQIQRLNEHLQVKSDGMHQLAEQTTKTLGAIEMWALDGAGDNPTFDDETRLREIRNCIARHHTTRALILQNISEALRC